MARMVNIARKAASRSERPPSGTLVAYQAYIIQDHQTGMKRAVAVARPAQLGLACSVLATAPTKQRSKKSSSQEAWRSACVVGGVSCASSAAAAVFIALCQ